MENDAPWKKQFVQPIAMPGMISDEESQYYEFIGALYEGRGEVVEMRSMARKSTRHIVRGLRKNSNFANKQLHVFDDSVGDELDEFLYAKRGKTFKSCRL